MNGGPQRRSWLDRLGQALLGEPRDLQELLDLLRDAQRRGLFSADALEMIEGALQVAEMQVRDVMIPRSQMDVLERSMGVEEMLPIVLESGHSRFPVIGESRDEVVGILLAKDLLGHFGRRDDAPFDIRDHLRQAVFVPEAKRLNVMLREFRHSRNHMAIVVDEYGGVAGLVTIEDVLEQIVGDIDDEFDVDEEEDVLRHSDSRFTVKARTPIEDFNEYFGSEFSDQDFDTIGGLVVHHIGHMPRRGEVVDLDGFRFEVLRADHRRIHLFRVTPPPGGATREA